MVRKIKIEKRCKKKKMKQRRFTNKKLIALMLPLAVDQLLNSFMGTVDTLVVSNLGSAAISAVSLVDSINILVVQAFFALASGGTVVCSHYLGCEKKERATNAARQLLFITFAMSLVGAGLRQNSCSARSMCRALKRRSRSQMPLESWTKAAGQTKSS